MFFSYLGLLPRENQIKYLDNLNRLTQNNRYNTRSLDFEKFKKECDLKNNVSVSTKNQMVNTIPPNKQFVDKGTQYDESDFKEPEKSWFVW